MQLHIGADRNRSDVVHELCLKKVRLAISSSASSRIFTDMQEHALSTRWKPFLKEEIDGPTSAPRLLWNDQALDSLGLDRSELARLAERAAVKERPTSSL